MPYPAFARDLAQRAAPGLMADRARRYERGFRERHGITAEAERLVAQHGAVVQAGPFAGMHYPADRIASVDTPAGKLLGTYEQEIQSVFTDALARGIRTFVDVGCADGYYAVGMPYADHRITSHAFDLAASARQLCWEVAGANVLEGHVRIGKRFTIAAVDGLEPDLLLCDIEGAEATLFDADLVARLRSAVVVIEVHETGRRGLGADLTSRFKPTHTVARIEQAYGADENRPADLHWLVCEPH